MVRVVVKIEIAGHKDPIIRIVGRAKGLRFDAGVPATGSEMYHVTGRPGRIRLGTMDGMLNHGEEA
jgi:hypothetical protein